MAIKFANAGSVKEGSYIIMDGVACKVVGMQTSKTGKHGHAKARIESIGLIDDKKREMVIPTSENIEIPIIEKKTAQVLSITGNKANVMDTETFETFDLDIPEDIKDELVEGCQVLYWLILNDKVMKQVKT
jgi:translation initiation factor 5A